VSSPSRSGVFRQSTDERMERFAESISFDWRLYAHDIKGSIAHAQMLQEVGLLSPEESQRIQDTLLEIQHDIETQQLEWCVGLEDIHMHIEQWLIDRLGDIGRKLHTGRSRNDQVSTDLRLWVRDALDRVDRQLVDLQAAFVKRCDGDRGCHSAGLHSPATRATRPGAALLAGLLRKIRTRPRSAGRLSKAGESVWTGRCRGGRQQLAD
jgi:argininosuccinate lyase